MFRVYVTVVKFGELETTEYKGLSSEQVASLQLAQKGHMAVWQGRKLMRYVESR